MHNLRYPGNFLEGSQKVKIFFVLLRLIVSLESIWKKISNIAYEISEKVLNGKIQ